jgi:hypothetical protein
MDINGSPALALRAGALVHFPDLLLDCRFGQLTRKRNQASAALALLVAETPVVIAFAAENNCGTAVIAFRHGVNW